MYSLRLIFILASYCFLLAFSRINESTIGQSKKEHTDNRGGVYESVEINDPVEGGSSGIYFRISQKGVDYLADLTSKGLPKIMASLDHFAIDYE
jgi:hypothetical protein